MEKWHCFKCKEEIIEAEVPSSYMEIESTVKALKCPKCGRAFVTEEIANETVEGEQTIESKV